MFEPEKRPIRSFVKREGKLTTGQRNAIDRLFPSFGVSLSDGLIDFQQLFHSDRPIILEIGFGNGSSLVEMAQVNPQTNFFGIEVHRPGLGGLLVQVDKQQLGNVRVSGDDAVNVVSEQIASQTLSRIQIFFPDPWHKKRHHKRRLMQAEFVSVLADKLQTGGVLHVATDWQNYAEHILGVLTAQSKLQNTAESYAPKPDYRPLTKYEQRGINLGHGVWDIVFKKRGGSE